MTDARFNVRNYIAPGPVSAAFIADDVHTVCAIMGPQGSGKTNACIAKAMRHLNLMPPCTDGVVRWKGAVVRDTYQQLYDTMVDSWWQWFPQEVGEWTGSPGRPASHRLSFTDVASGQRYEAEMEFKALQDNRIENIFKGWEGSFFHINEADTLSREALTFMYGRVIQARYPRPEIMTRSFRPAGILDFNPPDPENWLHELFEGPDTPPDFKLYKQPGGLDPAAENLTRRLPDGRLIRAMERSAYEVMVRNNPAWWSRRFVHGKYGFSRDGMPVYEHEFDDDLHCGGRLLPVLDTGVRLGFDAALHPACTFSQINPLTGQFQVIDELVPGWTGASEFGELVAAKLKGQFRGLPVERATCDPAAFGNDISTRTFVDTVGPLIGRPLRPAPSNTLDYRLGAVRKMLGMKGPKEPRLVISSACVNLRKGFNSMYRLAKIKVHGREMYDDKPAKSRPYSDVHDALQYDLLDFLGLAGVNRPAEGAITAAEAARRRRHQVTKPGDFDVHRLFR